MKLHHPLCFFYPTNIVLLDDNISFLEGLEGKLIGKFNIRSFSDPLLAIKEFSHNDTELDSDLFNEIDVVGTLEEDIECAININLTKIYNKIYKESRKSEISVIIVDYSMASMDGIEFCKLIRSPFIKKILLTGIDDKKLAIAAFNEGIIDRYISKGSSTCLSDIECAIRLLQRKYFQERCALVNAAITLQNDNFMKSSFFIDEFNHFINKNQIKEFYLLDSTGSFLGFDKSKNPHWFLVKSNVQMQGLESTAENGGASEDILLKLKNRKDIAYFFGKEQINIPPREWQRTMFPVSKKCGNYYIAVVDGVIPGFYLKPL